MAEYKKEIEINRNLNLNFWAFFSVILVVSIFFYWIKTWGEVEKLKVAAGYKANQTQTESYDYPVQLQGQPAEVNIYDLQQAIHKYHTQ